MKNWTRKRCKHAAWIALGIFFFYLFVLVPFSGGGFAVIPPKDYALWYQINMYGPLVILFPSIFFSIAWALKNDVRRYGISQAAGFAVIYLGIAYVWYTIWTLGWTWTYPISEDTVVIIYFTIILLCFLYPIVGRLLTRLKK